MQDITIRHHHRTGYEDRHVTGPDHWTVAATEYRYYEREYHDHKTLIIGGRGYVLAEIFPTEQP